MKLAGGVGMGVAMTPWLSQAFADGRVGAPTRPQAGGSANGPLVVQLIASGGWDPTLVCDPKGNALNQAYGEGDILTAGNISYAPIAGATAFWDLHYAKTLVLNGVDMKTNSHAAGQRFMASGRLGEGYPSLSAVAAGFAAPELPMAYLSFGGYDRTAGLVAPTRNLDANRLAELAHPDRTNGANENSETYHADAVQSVIRHARQNRAQAQLAQQRLPRYDASMDSMLTARMGADQLQLLEEVLPTPNGNGDFRRIELLVAAYKACL
ncbi:MAG: Tat pathway signal protein, partial [Nannocystaceae bacterium]|nr:Tat pathway signal protein [Nannocystaceae bacterium]